MDDRIAKALAALGLSQERIAEFGELLERVKQRVHSEHLITRRPGGIEQRKELNKEALKPRRPSVRITYAGPNAPANYARKAGATLARIEAMRKRVSAPPVAPAQDSQGVRLPPPDDAAPWQKRAWANAERFAVAGAHDSLGATHAALDKSRQRGRKKKV